MCYQSGKDNFWPVSQTLFRVVVIISLRVIVSTGLILAYYFTIAFTNYKDHRSILQVSEWISSNAYRAFILNTKLSAEMENWDLTWFCCDSMESAPLRQLLVWLLVLRNFSEGRYVLIAICSFGFLVYLIHLNIWINTLAALLPFHSKAF